jgi:hypothetical protein
MSDTKIPALEDDCPIARRHRPFTMRRTVLLDQEAWNAMARAQPIRRDVVENAPPGSITARALERGRRGRGCGNPDFKCTEGLRTTRYGDGAKR